MIPRSILEKTLFLFENLDFATNPNCYDYYDLIFELRSKLLRLQAHDAYTKFMSAADEDARHNARIEYLRLRNNLRDFDSHVNEIPF